MKDVILATLSLIWVILCACAYRYWHWDGALCLVASCPGVFGFITNCTLSS